MSKVFPIIPQNTERGADYIEQSGMRQAAYSGMHNVNPGILSLNQTDRVMRDPWNTLKSPEWGRKRKLPPRQA